jgi:hypothetical protein
VRRIVERELVAQSPREDAEPEQHQSHAEDVEAPTAGNPAGMSQVGGVSNQCRDAIERRWLNDDISFDDLKAPEVSRIGQKALVFADLQSIHAIC